MIENKKSPFSLSIEALEQELLARSSQIPSERLFLFNDTEGTTSRHNIMKEIKKSLLSPPALNSALADINTYDLAKILVFKTKPGMDCTRGNLAEDILDCYEITDAPILNNTLSVAALCNADDLHETSHGHTSLKTKNYGKTFNLCELEPFRDQPIATGNIGTGFLLSEDILATTNRWIEQNNLTHLRVLFGYSMTDIGSPNTTFQAEDIYHVRNIIQQGSSLQGDDWVLLKLDRKVTGYKKVVLSKTKISSDQEIYVIGHPLGLPLKYSAGAFVEETHDSSFTVNLNIYAPSSGSPVFDQNTHHVIGIVVSSNRPNFIWTGNGWLSVNSPDGTKITCALIPEKLLDLAKA